jgi:hypothetical protein
VAIDAFARAGCSSFKIGSSALGLVRPDKFVAYFRSLEELEAAGSSIVDRAAGSSSQGVPFTGAIDPGGLVSWGMDPPQTFARSGSADPPSWRQWLTEKVAAYVVAAPETAISKLPVEVLSRLALDGVDTTTWSPNPSIWRSVQE